MRLYRILIVDDEPHVVDAMTMLLEKQHDLALDIYFAYSGRQAIDIMRQGRIDLLITDIQMPEISGIELVDFINNLWPTCKTIFLTAYSDFNYAYAAIRKHVVSYILKTEEDEYILREVHKALAAIDNDLNQKQLLDSSLKSTRQASKVNKNIFQRLLDPATGKDNAALLSLLGFTLPLEPVYLLLGLYRSSGSENPNTLIAKQADYRPATLAQDILNHYMGEHLRHSACETDDQGRILWVFQADWTAVEANCADGMTSRWLSGILETVQSSCRSTAGIDLSFIISAPITDLRQLGEIYTILLTHAQRLSGSTESFIFHGAAGCEPISSEPSVIRQSEDLAKGIIRCIKDYIAAHIAEDVSLMQLSTITGYNDTYLSNIFHKQTGELLGKYISRQKLQLITDLMKKSELTINAVCDMAGFGSRPYFNRFIKKETGMTPKNYRLTVLNRQVQR